MTDVMPEQFVELDTDGGDEAAVATGETGAGLDAVDEQSIARLADKADQGCVHPGVHGRWGGCRSDAPRHGANASSSRTLRGLGCGGEAAVLRVELAHGGRGRERFGGGAELGGQAGLDAG